MSKALPGQVLPLFALGMLALLLMVGLAVDGGLLFAGKRRAQNVADAAAMAASTSMLSAYEAMAASNSLEQDGSPEDEKRIWETLGAVARTYNLAQDALTGYFTDIVGNQVGEPLGKNGSVPFVAGARGINVRVRTEVGTVLMAVAGYATVQVGASATGFMAPASDFDPDTGMRPGVLPFAFSRSNIESQSGRSFSGVSGVDGPGGYVLLDGPVTPSSKGEWDWLNFNGVADAQPQGIAEAWKECGYHPALRVGTGKPDNPFQWPRYCEGGRWQDQEGTTGPTQYWQFRPRGAEDPPAYAHNLRWGPDENTGWWIAAFQRQPYSSCGELGRYLESLAGTRRPIVIFDDTEGDGRGLTWRHTYYVGLFAFNRVSVNCSRFEERWHLDGAFVYSASPNAAGSVYPPNPRTPWDLWGSSFHLTYLQP